MFSFFKKNRIIVPRRASFFNEEEYKRFVVFVEAFFIKREIEYKLNDDVVVTFGNDVFVSLTPPDEFLAMLNSLEASK